MHIKTVAGQKTSLLAMFSIRNFLWNHLLSFSRYNGQLGWEEAGRSGEQEAWWGGKEKTQNSNSMSSFFFFFFNWAVLEGIKCSLESDMFEI